MADYIDRDRVLGFLHSCHPTKWEGTLPDGRICHYSDVIDGVAAIPVMTTGWISVKDKRPEPFCNALCRHVGGDITCGVVLSDGSFLSESFYGPVAYWMPLPAPPEEANNADDS